MKHHNSSVAPLALLALLASALLLVGCSGSGGGGGSGVSVAQVDPVSLSGSVSTGDFGGHSGTPLPPSGDKNGALEGAFGAVGAIGYSIGSFLDENPDWMDTQPSVSYTATPSDFADWETASSVAMSATVDPTTMNLTSTNESGTVTFEASAEVAANLSTFSDGGQTTLDRLTGSLSVGGVELTASDVSSTDIDAPPQSVQAGRALLAINANLDVDPSYDMSTGYAELSRVDAAASVSVALAIALSATGSGSDYGGNYLIEATYTDTATLSLTEALMNDPQALEDYLDSRLDGGAFNLRIRVYDGTTLRNDFSYTIDDIVNFMETM